MKKSTLAILQHLHDRLPPCVPEEHVCELRVHLDECKQKDEGYDDLHYVVAIHGQRLWPYVKAFEEMQQGYTADMAEKLLAQRMPAEMQKKMQLFRELGGSFGDLYLGRAHDMFNSDERQHLMELLVDLKQDIRKHARQKIMSQDTEKYKEKVEKYGKIVEEVNAVLEDITQFAHEEAHERIAEDIHDKVRTIEQSFAFIGPSVDMEEIRNLKEHYQARQHHLKVRGMLI